MRYLLVPALVMILADDLTAAEPVQLTNDPMYAAKVQAVLAAQPAGTDQQALFPWIWSYSSACLNNRDYTNAEAAARALLALAPQYNLVHSNLSVVLGKQGKYQEALQEAEIAVLLNPSDRMHPDAVACSWLYYLGRKQEAIDRFKRIAVPTEPHAARAYWGCSACFYATVGDVGPIKAAIATALQLEPTNTAFFERDPVFDAYRAEPWFIALVGKTLR